MKAGHKPLRVCLAGLLAAALCLTCGIAARAETAYLPGVTGEMTQAAYWSGQAEDPDALLASADEIAAINAAVLACEACRMTDLRAELPAFDGVKLQRALLSSAMRDLSEYLKEGYFNSEGGAVPYEDIAAILDSIAGAEPAGEQEVRYGICVEQADLRAVPSDALITDAAGDNDFDMLQLSALLVNEPVILRACTADGRWYYCDSSCVSGWVEAEKIAVCADRAEWLSAWDIPEEELLVVTQGKILLDESHVNAAASRRLLTMGTTLRRVDDAQVDTAVTNRAPYHNYAVVLPVRDEEGRYTTTTALISEHESVSEGSLPLTAENLLRTAFSMLGDAYGWGGMLSVPDCSLYIRSIYKCFGLELARNTTWQAAMPVRKAALGELETAEKAALLDTLPAGTVLFFNGHEMLYLGQAQGKHYVLSSVSSMMDPEGDSRLRVRSVVINTLEDTRRANGRTWLEDCNLAVIPWLPEAEETADAARETIEQVLVLYGTYGEAAAEEIDARLSALEETDAAAAETWKKILALWRDDELTVNEGELPGDLPDTDELCLVALGFQLNPDGTMREELLQRLEVLKRCAEQYPRAWIVCTGGGTARDNPEATEAGAMAAWLAENGVDSARILVEDRSQTTAQNAAFTLKLLAEQAPQVKQLAIVSSDYHIATGTLLFGAEALLREADVAVVSNAAWKAPSGSLPPMFQAGALIELLGDTETAYEIYYDTYDIHELLPPQDTPAPAEAA